MLVLPFQTISKTESQSITGFSVSGMPKSILFVFGFLGFVALSSAYHSNLYGHTMANWVFPMILLAVIPFGYRIRVGLSLDKKILLRQYALFGIVIREKVTLSEGFKGFYLVPTGAVDKQFYWVVGCEENDISLHYCKLKAKEVPILEHRLSCMLGY